MEPFFIKPDTVLNHNIQVWIVVEVLLHKFQQLLASFRTLFSGLVLVEGQCEVGIVPSRQAAAMKRIAKIVCTKRTDPSTRFDKE